MSNLNHLKYFKYSYGTKLISFLKPQSIGSNNVNTSLILFRNRSHSSSRHSSGGFKIYKSIFLFICLPVIIGLSYWNYNQHVHEKSCYQRPPFVKYSYLYLRSKRFPWGDGNKSLFHNKEKNALPEGYED
ncbi:hypothetical protein WA026_000166 [Henosepilachna vigintioctopunctata]|uniref:Cytochrome c oxidase subunit n=1 Tax=Henosepilachna vigintioctopunctata TaxID=420089 RepID=A0AAW1UYE4_9CUCU